MTVTHANLQQEFGVFSSTRTNLQFGNNSTILTFYGGGASSPLLTNQALGLVAGEPILQTSVNQTGTTSYSGWAVQFGTNSPTTNTLDMSAYYDGIIRFYFSAPRALLGTMTLGIRSGNVASGSEESTVSLDAYATFDGQWHAVAIPIAALAGPRPKADLSRIQDLCTITVTGGVGVQTFSIEDVRWDSGITAANSGLLILSEAIAAPNFQLAIAGSPGLAFAIQTSTNLVDWSTLHNAVLGNGVFGYVHSNAMLNPSIFYRILGTP